MNYIILNSSNLNEPIKTSYIDDNQINNNNQNINNNNILLNNTFDREFHNRKFSDDTKINKYSINIIKKRKKRFINTINGYSKKKTMKLNIIDSNINKINKKKKNNQFHYNSDDGINIKIKVNKIQKQFFKENSLKLNNLSKISENVNNENLNKSFSKLYGKEKIKKILLGESDNLNDNSNECDYEDNKSESQMSKKELKSINSCLKMNLCLFYKKKTNSKIKKYKQYKIFEEGISDKLNKIKKNSNVNKEKILKLLQNKIYNFITESNNKIKKEREKRSLKTLNQINKIYIPLIIKNTKQNIKIIKQFEKLYFKLLKIATFIVDPNINYIKDILLLNYCQIDIPNLILKKKYLEKDNQIENPIIINFQINNQTRKLRTIRSIKRRDCSQLSFDNSLFIYSFCKKDIEYEVKNYNWIIKIISNNINQLNKNNIILKKNEWKFNSIKQNDNNKNEKNKKLFNSLLTKNDFYTRFKEHKRNNTEKISLKSSNIFYLINQIKTNKKTNNYINNNDLNNKMIKSINNMDLLFFHIKNKNFYGFKKVFEKNKINPDLCDYNGNSLLILSIKNNCFQIANYLLNIGASINLPNRNNNTPLHFAFSLRNFEIADMLIRQGANETIKNKFGILPWDCLDNKLSII